MYTRTNYMYVFLQFYEIHLMFVLVTYKNLSIVRCTCYLFSAKQMKFFTVHVFEQQFIRLISRVRGPYGKLWTKFFPSFYGPNVERTGHENKEGKNEDP